MRAANAITNISKETLKNIFIIELQEKGVTESVNGTRIEDLDFYQLRHEVFRVRCRETRIESPEMKWF